MRTLLQSIPFLFVMGTNISTTIQAFQTPYILKSLTPKWAAQTHTSQTQERTCENYGESTKLEMSLYPVSGVDTLPVFQQQLIFFGTFAGLGIGTKGLLKGFDAVENVLPENWFANWKSTWPVIGVVYVLAGLAHFGVSDAFVGIYPPQGTWGLWYLPGSPGFHVAWTGIAELMGGAGLVVGSFCRSFVSDEDVWENLTRLSAGSLAALTVAVTPANIYMYSHGAIMVGAGPDGPVDLQFHVIRFIAQVLLLGLLTSIATTPRKGGNGSVESINEA